MIPDDEPRYTLDELFDLYLQFVRDPKERRRLMKYYEGSPFESSRVVIQFIAYLKNQDSERAFKWMEAVAWRRESELFGEPGTGDLFNVHNPQ
jgi:hypothetical protein